MSLVITFWKFPHETLERSLMQGHMKKSTSFVTIPSKCGKAQPDSRAKNWHKQNWSIQKYSSPVLQKDLERRWEWPIWFLLNLIFWFWVISENTQRFWVLKPQPYSAWWLPLATGWMLRFFSFITWKIHASHHAWGKILFQWTVSSVPWSPSRMCLHTELPGVSGSTGWMQGGLHLQIFAQVSHLVGKFFPLSKTFPICISRQLLYKVWKKLKLTTSRF